MAEAKKEWGTKVKTNLRDRVNSITIIPENTVTMAETFMKYTKETKPIQGLLEASKKAFEGTLEFLRKQCEITRRWWK